MRREYRRTLLLTFMPSLPRKNQLQERFAIIPLCEFHHSVNRFQDGGGMNKRMNVAIALRRATEVDRKKYPL
jgi:hypothetical protein